MHCSSPVRDPGAITNLPLLSEFCQGGTLSQPSLQIQATSDGLTSEFVRKRPFWLMSISIALSREACSSMPTCCWVAAGVL